MGDPLRAQTIRRPAVLRDTCDGVAQLGTEGPERADVGPQVVRPRRAAAVEDVPRQQLGEVGVLVGAGEQTGITLAGEPGIGRDDRVSVGGDRAGERAGQHRGLGLAALGEPQCQPVAQHGRAAPRGGEHEHALGREAIVEDGGGDEVEHRAGLARTGSPEYHHPWPVPGLQNRPLRRVGRESDGRGGRHSDHGIRHRRHRTGSAVATMATPRRSALGERRGSPERTRVQ